MKITEITLDKLRSMNAQAADIIAAAKMSIIFGNNPNNCMFKESVISLSIVPGWWQPTMITDGTKITYNPAFVIDMSLPKESKISWLLF